MRPACAALALLLAACGDEAPPDYGAQVPEADRALGAEQHPRLLAEFGGAYRGDEARYVAAVGGRMAAAAGLERQCTFTLVNSDVVNAFAVPGCYIYVTRGLLAIVTSEAELASVLGHEVGHIVGSHSRRQERRSLWRTLGVIAIGLTGSESLTRLAGQAAQYFTLRYSRKQEFEADDLGVGYLQRAGYDPHAAAEMLSALGRQQSFMVATKGRDEARSIPEWALSHPLTQNRIERARTSARTTGLADDALAENADVYLREVDGLLYGDDPEQGFVLGRRFAHPVMRIVFDAPEGFTLTNSPHAVMLSGPGGVRGEFGGAQMSKGGLEPHAKRLAQQVVGDAPAEVTGVQRTSINGLPAILMRLQLATRNGAAPLSIAAYDGGGGEAYHFVVVSPPSNGSAPAIEALFGSFRRLSPDEAAELRPRVIRTIAVGPQDRLDTIARRMADAHPRELFAMLNGRRTDQPLRQGERVKIVTFADGGSLLSKQRARP